MFREIDAEVYIMVDGDDTYPAECAPEMVDAVINKNADMVVGDRLSSTYFQENKRPFHNFGNSIVRWSNRILRQIIIDFQISIFQVILHSWPKRISIGNSLSHATSWWYFSISLFHPFFKGVKYGSCLNAGGVHIVPAHRVFGHLLSVQYDIVPVYSLIVS